MGFYLFHIVAFIATLFFVRSQQSNFSEHNEIHRARSQIDSLVYKLTLDLNNFIQKKNLAHATEKEAQRLAGIAQEEIAVLTPVQHVLEKLAKKNTYSGYLCSTTRSGEIKVRIEAKGSLLPKHYTIIIPGKKNNGVLCNQTVSRLAEETKSTLAEGLCYLFQKTIGNCTSPAMPRHTRRQSFRRSNKTKLMFA